MSRATLELLREHNRDRLVAISELEGIICSRNNRNCEIKSLEDLLTIEVELYDLDLKAIKKLREEIKI